jgi:hypothetical protein
MWTMMVACDEAGEGRGGGGGSSKGKAAEEHDDAHKVEKEEGTVP